MKTAIIKAILETLVVENKESINYAVDKITAISDAHSSLQNRSLVEENKRLNDIFAANEADITRVEVIEESGRAYVNWKPENKVKIMLQDNGRTLKIFVSALSYKEGERNE